MADNPSMALRLFLPIVEVPCVSSKFAGLANGWLNALHQGLEFSLSQLPADSGDHITDLSFNVSRFLPGPAERLVKRAQMLMGQTRTTDDRRLAAHLWGFSHELVFLRAIKFAHDTLVPIGSKREVHNGSVNPAFHLTYQLPTFDSKSVPASMIRETKRTYELTRALLRILGIDPTPLVDPRSVQTVSYPVHSMGLGLKAGLLAALGRDTLLTPERGFLEAHLMRFDARGPMVFTNLLPPRVG